MEVFSTPQPPPTEGQGMMGKDRIHNMGVCAVSTIAPPQFEYNESFLSCFSKVVKKNFTLLGNFPEQISMVKTLWLTSAQLETMGKASAAVKTLEELVPCCYHFYIKMFWKTKAMKLPPHRKHNFKVNLIPGAKYNHPNVTSREKGTQHTCGKSEEQIPPPADNGHGQPSAECWYIHKFFLHNAYGNVQVAEGNEDKLAFICWARQFYLLTMTHQSTRVLPVIHAGNFTGEDWITNAYMDDTMVLTQKGSNYAEAVNGTLEILSKPQLWFKPKKWEFSNPGVEYLGLLIAFNRIQSL